MNEELLELSLIDSFRNHPFLVQEDESLFELMNSITESFIFWVNECMK